MTDQAWAIEIKDENHQAILSEAGGHFDREVLEKWVEIEGGGYFVRDRSSSLDCSLMRRSEFMQLYGFAHGDETALFREIIPTRR